MPVGICARRKRSIQLCLLAAGLALTAAACGNIGGPRTGPSPTAVGGPEAYVDWENPIHGDLVPLVNGNVEAAVAAIQSEFLFPIHIPEGLGTPTAVYITRVGVVPPQDMVVAFIYETPEYGLVDVQEHLPDVAVDEYQETNRQLAAQTADPDLTVRGSIFTAEIRGGVEALMTTAPDGVPSDIRWLEAGTFEILVRGADLTVDECIAIGNGL